MAPTEHPGCKAGCPIPVSAEQETELSVGEVVWKVRLPAGIEVGQSGLWWRIKPGSKPWHACGMR